MDLQLILILIGAALVAFIAWDSYRRSVMRAKNTRSVSSYSNNTRINETPIEPVLDNFSDEPQLEPIDLEDVRQHFHDNHHLHEEISSTEQTASAPTEPERNTDLIVLFILAKPGKNFSGIELFHQFERLYLCFGDMDIFHRHKTENGEGPVLFSVASALEPGVFSYDEPESFSTTGLTLFMQLPGNFKGGDAFEVLLHTARLLTQRLDANLCDSKRQPITTDTLEKYRQIAQQYG